MGNNDNIYNAYAEGVCDATRVDQTDLYAMVYQEQAINENGQQSLGGLYESMLLQEEIETIDHKTITDAYTVVTEQKETDQPTFEQYYYIPDACFER